jgi:hypothetical protein
MGRKIVMQCATPVMSADGVQIHAPGEQLPEGHPAIEDSPLSWYPVIIESVDGDAVDAAPAPEPAPEPVVAPPVEPSAPVDF